MPANPYQSPIESENPLSRNVIGGIGFSLSLIGVIGLLFAGSFNSVIERLAAHAVFLCPPGLIASYLGLRQAPRALARCGVYLGIFGSLFVPPFIHYLYPYVFR